MKTFRASVAAAIPGLLVFAACSEPRTTITAPEIPSYNGGYTFGGGNRTDTAATTSAQGSDPAADVAERGGMGYGSGN